VVTSTTSIVGAGSTQGTVSFLS